MRLASFVTTVGTSGAGQGGRGIVIAHEPEVGAVLRTRGRFYLLCEIDPPSRRALEIATEVTELARHDYYYDLSAGVEVGLRRALRTANRRAAQLIRDERARIALHAATAVVVNNEMHAARVGGAQVFLVRHARLFLPGDEPGELADFVHRTTTRQAASLGAEMDLLPLVWRQTIEADDTIILASSAVVDALGAEALKNAAITLHPRAAAEHVHDRFVAEGGAGSDATVFIELAPASGAATRLGGEPDVPLVRPAEVVMAETIRSRLDRVWRLRPRPGGWLAAALGPLARLSASALAVILELLPRRRPELPRRPESARARSARGQRVTSLLALLLLVVTLAIGSVVVRDYQQNQVVNDYRLAVIDVEQDIATSRSFAGRKDTDRAWERLDAASRRLLVAERSPAAERARLTQLHEEIGALEDKLNGVVIDLALTAPGSMPAHLTQTANGLYVADPGAGRLWRIFGDPVATGVVLERGRAGVATPIAVTSQGDALLTLDDARKLWRAEGNTVSEVPLPKPGAWKSITDIATFARNVYVLDARAGQMWRYEPDFRGHLDGPVPFLPAPLAPDVARGLAVDGDIWVLAAGGDLQRYRKQGSDPVLTKLPFAIQWSGAPLRPTHVQALEAQRSIWVLDATAGVIAQVTRDGRELARFALPPRLPEATAFFVSEGQRRAYTVHGSKIVATDVVR